MTKDNPEFKKYLHSGKFTKADERIEVISQFITSDKKGKCNSVTNYILTELKHKPELEMENFRKRTASQIVESNYVTGNTDCVLVFCALARHMGIPTRYVETFEEDYIFHGNLENRLEIHNHAFVDVKIETDDKWKVYDVLRGFREYNAYMAKPKDSRSYNHYMEVGKGLDFSEIYLKNKDGSYEKNTVCINTIDEMIKRAKYLKRSI